MMKEYWCQIWAVWVQGPTDATRCICGVMRFFDGPRWNGPIVVVLSRKPVGSCKDEVWAAKCVVGESKRKLKFSMA